MLPEQHLWSIVVARERKQGNTGVRILGGVIVTANLYGPAAAAFMVHATRRAGPDRARETTVRSAGK